MSGVTYLSLGVIQVNADGSWTPNYYLIAYYAICIILTANVYSFLKGQGQTIACVAIIPLFILVFLFFIIRWNWFAGPKLSREASLANECQTSDTLGSIPASPFPPIVNMCPDFMTAWTDNSNRKVYCYDANNTYNMQTGTGAGLATGLSINGLSGQSAYLLFDPNVNTSAKLPKGDDGGLRWPLYARLKNNMSSISNDPNGRYLRWEGILESTGSLAPYWDYNMLRALPGVTG